MTKKDLSAYKSSHINLAVFEEILAEYSKDKYWHIGEVFKEEGANRDWPSFTVFYNWMKTGEATELTKLFMDISDAKKSLLEFKIIDMAKDDSKDYLRKSDGNYWLDEQGRPIKNDPHLTRLKMVQNTLNAVNMAQNPLYGKVKIAEEEKTKQESTVETIAKAFEMMSRNVANTKVSEEKDVTNAANATYIEHE